MKNKTFTYIILMLLIGIAGSSMNGYAQRAKKHREGILNIDSIRAQNAVDSIALLDTLQLQRQRSYLLETAVDTAALIQESDSIQQQNLKVKEKKKWIPIPNNSIWFALAIPGAGQIYNHKYWKLPLVYGGFVGCVYALNWNGQMYKDYSQAYQDIMSDTPNNDSYLDFLPPGYTYEVVQGDLAYYQNLIRSRKDQYRRQRDLSIIAFIAVYLLSVVDAYVDAELSNFDISNDLSMTLEPTILNDSFRHRPQGIGLQCNIKF